MKHALTSAMALGVGTAGGACQLDPEAVVLDQLVECEMSRDH